MRENNFALHRLDLWGASSRSDHPRGKTLPAYARVEVSARAIARRPAALPARLGSVAVHRATRCNRMRSRLPYEFVVFFMGELEVAISDAFSPASRTSKTPSFGSDTQLRLIQNQVAACIGVVAKEAPE